MFCFGFALHRAYLLKDITPTSKVLKTSMKCYTAYLVSGLAFLTLVDGQSVSARTIGKILLIRIIPGYSEFLLTFSAITILALVLKSQINFITSSIKALSISCVALLFSTFLPKDVRYDPLVGEFIGGTGFAYFPVLQYFPLFLIGVWFSRNAITEKRLAIVATAAFGALMVIYIATELKTSRFPPSIIWILASGSAVLIYYAISTAISRRAPFVVVSYLNSVGQNVLPYLLLSNVTLFTIHALGNAHTFGSAKVLVSFFALMALIYFIQIIMIDPEKSRRALSRAKTDA